MSNRPFCEETFPKKNSMQGIFTEAINELNLKKNKKERQIEALNGAHQMKSCPGNRKRTKNVELHTAHCMNDCLQIYWRCSSQLKIY